MRIRKNTGNFDEELDIEFIAKVSDALAHPARLILFRHIMHKNQAMENVCTGDLVNEFDYSQSTISQHMKKLTSSGLVELKKHDRFSYYYANLGILMRYINLTKKYSIS